MNIVLIGMPGAGKSTVGVILAKALGYGFIDTDILLCANTGMKLQTYINSFGMDRFLEAEEKTALSIDTSNTVIATGGSMVYSEAAMEHLGKDAVTVFLDIPLTVIKNRLNNIKTRGIAARPGESIEDIFNKRLPLYRKYAEITVPDNTEKAPDVEDAVQKIIQAVT